MVLTFVVIIYLCLFEGAPFVEIIQSSSVDPINYGNSLNLTCSAKLTKKKILTYFLYKNVQPCTIEWWLNSKKMVQSCSRECSQAKGVMNCTLTLGGRENQLKATGNFSCKASNGNSQCTLKRILLKSSFGEHVIQVFTYVLRHSTWSRPR